MNNVVKMKQNYSKALDLMRRGTKIKFDPDVSTYLRLSSEALKALRTHYGDEQVEQYVVEMEQRREAQDGQEE